MVTHTDRTYRQLVHSRLSSSRVAVQETDLNIYGHGQLSEVAKEAVITQRGYLENYIRLNPKFVQTLSPWPEDTLAPAIVQEMIQAGQKAQVGPMAAVAGAMAEWVGKELLSQSDEIIVENGGDIFLSTHHPLIVAVYAGNSPLSLKIGLKVKPAQHAMGVCTSSATVGHSLSIGNTDAVCVVSNSCALADATATAIGNHVHQPADIDPAIQWARQIDEVKGILVIIGDKMGMWGEIQLVPL